MGPGPLSPGCRRRPHPRPRRAACGASPPWLGDASHSFDRLRVLATGGVVLLHGGAGVIGPRLGEPSAFFLDVNAANVYDSAGRFAVDCFFMISAALLLAPERSFALVRQTRRVAVPLLTWSLVYVAFAVWASRTGC